MRKQVDFDFRVYPVGATEGTYNHTQLSAEIRTQYIEQGWEVLKTEVTQVSANVIYLAVSLVKYQELPSIVPMYSGVQGGGQVDEVKRGPGRPKKEEVVPA